MKVEYMKTRSTVHKALLNFVFKGCTNVYIHSRMINQLHQLPIPQGFTYDEPINTKRNITCKSQAY